MIRLATLRRGRLLQTLFPDRWNGALSAFALAFIGWAMWQAFDWAVLRAALAPDAERCFADGVGACWGVITEKHRALLFGRYPYAEQWRPMLAVGVLLLAVVITLFPRSPRALRIAVWLPALPVFFALMAGGVAGLTPVPSRQWGGLPLTVMLWLLAVAIALPVGVLTAMGRHSGLPAVRTLCGLFVELLRGVPLVSILFMASFMVPLLLPPEARVDMLLRVQVALGLFGGAYLSENIRGGIQAVPAGQVQAALSLGMTPRQADWLVVLPQALRHALPAMFNSFIGLFKETTLVTVVSLYELTGSLSLAIGGDPVWRPFFLEAYLFIGAIYWLCCFSLSRYSRGLERRLAATSA
ncbi:MAG: amino acid ABC transporter permease [Moraxellaceae bacterium]|nr:amino acid ABC transporter permease [Moraxellaceae bacterium]